MRRSTARWLRAFPRAWRDRYGEEVRALIEDLEGDDDLRAVDRLDLLRSGLRTRTHSRPRLAVLVAASCSLALAGTLVGLGSSGVFSPALRSHRSTPRAVVDALSIASHTFGPLSLSKVHESPEMATHPLTPQPGPVILDTHWTVAATDTAGTVVVGVLVTGTQEIAAAWSPSSAAIYTWIFPVSTPTRARQTVHHGAMMTTAARAPHAKPSIRAAASKKGRLVTACDAVVVPPAKDAENNVTLAVKSSMVDALARSGNRVLERVAKAIKKAGRHKNEAEYVRDELLKARSECRKLGITST